MMKNTVDPMAVQSGVFAALMAQKDFSGTEKVFEGKEGFMDAFIGWNAKDETMKPTDMDGRDGVSTWAWDSRARTQIKVWFMIQSIYGIMKSVRV